MDKLLTKEEILKANHAKKVLNWEKVFVQNPVIIESAYESMDEWAKIMSIRFVEWVFKNGYVNHGKGWHKVGHSTGATKKTTEQLYNLFLESIKEEQQ